MRQKDFVRDNLREGLKAKGRLRRDSVRRRAAVERGKRHARNDLLPGLKIEAVPIDRLRSYSRRLRKSDAAHAEEIANSIGALGFSIPLLIGKANVVIDGEARLEAARLLGLRSVPCIRIDHLNEDEQRLLRLAANRLGFGAFTGFQLKIIQEAITVAVFIVFAITFLKERMAWNYALSFVLLIAAVVVAFAFKSGAA